MSFCLFYDDRGLKSIWVIYKQFAELDQRRWELWLEKLSSDREINCFRLDRIGDDENNEKIRFEISK